VSHVAAIAANEARTRVDGEAVEPLDGDEGRAWLGIDRGGLPSKSFAGERRE